jgi:hypothetical protein
MFENQPFVTKILGGRGYWTEVIFPSPRLIPTNSFFLQFRISQNKENKKHKPRVKLVRLGNAG